MRISTSMIFDAGVSAMNKQSAALLHIQQQVASGRRILTPADDPVAAARALEVTQSQDVLAQYATNQSNATSVLEITETQLSSLTDMFGRLKELTVQAGGPALTATNRASIAVELRARYDQLLGIANAADGQGQYLFSGYQGATKPFAGTVDQLNAAPGNEITYYGDDGQRTLQVSATRQIEVSDPGSDVFMRNGNGESVFKTLATLIGQLEANDVSGLTVANTRLDQAGQNILRARASTGSRLNELESLGYLNQDMSLQYQQILSKLQDLDYAKAITDLTRKQTELEAAQQSFAKISQLSLFNYL
ncbi:MAG: flagellar hook-associated protein FlgL [Rhodocyclaceae bacterium]|nr:flagellar hook-associated protein FlgL [Rhodocyclaceae bacterium]